MKKCYTCKKKKPLTDFGPRTIKGKSVLRGSCKTCYNAYQVKRRRTNKKAHRTHRDTVRRNTTEKRKWVQSLKHEKACEDCGVPYPHWILDFDHRPGTNKEGSVSQMWQNRGRAVILEEIAKCDLVCSNCHRDRTYKRAHPNARESA